MEKDVPIGDQKVKKLLGDYLFNPATDGATPVNQLSGGQKARFQLIRMLCNDPIILVLDEPTNHLDLPSIEELEDALARTTGQLSTSRTTVSSPKLLVAKLSKSANSHHNARS